MLLKFRYRLGYESLGREVADSIWWQRFCRIPLGHFEQYVVACGEPARARELPPPGAPDMDRAVGAGERFRIEVLGPPPATLRP